MSEKIQKGKRETIGGTKMEKDKDIEGRWVYKGKRRIACLPGLFGDDFTPSINQPSPLLSLLQLLALLQRVV